MTQPLWDWKAQFNHEPADQVFDCMLAEFLLSQGKSVVTLDEALLKYKVENIDQLAIKQLAAFKKIPSLHAYFTTIEMQMIPVLWSMENAGIFLHVDGLKKVGSEIDRAVTELNQSMKREVGVDINLNSSVQIGNFLAEKLMVPLKKTKTGRFATNETEISQYAQTFPFIQSLLQYRELAKLRSTYTDTLIAAADPAGRIHTTYSQTIAHTGRLSSNNPNLQNIPGSSEFGQKIKSCFAAGEGNVLISFDYSQQELRILAHVSHEKSLIEAFQSQQDIHTTTAALIFHVEYDAVSPAQRKIAKTINFGVIYGMSSFGMSAQLHISVEEAQTFINAFYKTYPNIHSYYDAYLKQGMLHGFVETLLGRRRLVFGQNGQKTIDNATRRMLINYPIQGSAADLIKKAMITIQSEVVEKSPDCKLLLQIHDDLVFEVKYEPTLIAQFVAQVKDIMCGVYPLSVPIEVDVKIGKVWGEMRSLSQL